MPPARPRSRRPGQRHARQRRHFARDAEHAHAVAAVRRQVELEDRVVEAQRVDAAPRPLAASAGSSSRPLASVRQAELARRAQHAGRFDAAQLRLPDLHAARQLRADRRQRRLQPGARIRRAADDLHASPCRCRPGRRCSVSAFGCFTRSTISPDDHAAAAAAPRPRCLRPRGPPSSGARRGPAAPAAARRSIHSTIAD